MTIEIVEGRYFAATWFLGPGRVGEECADIHGALWRDPGGPWTIQFRIRYYADARTGSSSEDRKVWHRGVCTDRDASEEDVIGTTSETFAQMAEIINAPRSSICTVLLQTDRADKVIALIAKQPWAHPGLNASGGDA